MEERGYCDRNWDYGDTRQEVSRNSVGEGHPMNDVDFVVMPFCPFCHYPQGHAATCKCYCKGMTRKQEWEQFFKEKEK